MPSLPRIRGADAKSVFMSFFIPVGTLLVYYTMLEPFVGTLTGVKIAMCGGNQDFVWTTDKTQDHSSVTYFWWRFGRRGGEHQESRLERSMQQLVFVCFFGHLEIVKIFCGSIYTSCSSFRLMRLWRVNQLAMVCPLAKLALVFGWAMWLSWLTLMLRTWMIWLRRGTKIAKIWVKGNRCWTTCDSWWFHEKHIHHDYHDHLWLAKAI